MRRTFIVVALLICLLGTTGCALLRRSSSGVSHTPKQVLWQLREQVIQVARDVEDLNTSGLLSESRYRRMRAQVENVAASYNTVKHAYEVTQKLDASSLEGLRLSLAILTRELVAAKGGDA